MKFHTTLCTLVFLLSFANEAGAELISKASLHSHRFATLHSETLQNSPNLTVRGIATTIGGPKWRREGSLIGSANGLVTEKLVGAALDEQDRKIMQQTSPRTVDRMDRAEPLTINDVIKLSQGGVSDDAIISYIQEKKTIYNLTQAQVRRLRDAGVSQRVIDFMLTKNRY